MPKILFQLLALSLDFIALCLFLLVLHAFPLRFANSFAGNAFSFLLNELLLILTQLFSHLTFVLGGFSVLVRSQGMVRQP